MRVDPTTFAADKCVHDDQNRNALWRDIFCNQCVCWFGPGDDCHHPLNRSGVKHKPDCGTDGSPCYCPFDWEVQP